MRPDTWERDFAIAIEAARVRQFAWWDHDCVTAACRLAGAAMGRDLLAPIKVRWTSRTGPLFVGLFGGIEGCLVQFAASAGLTPVPWGKAMRGSLVLVRQHDGIARAGCVLGARVAVVREGAGYAELPLATIERAWSD